MEDLRKQANKMETSWFEKIRSDLEKYYQVPWEKYWLDKIDDDLIPLDRGYLYRMNASINMIDEAVKAPIKVLDIGCGIGIYALNIAKKFKNAVIHGIDICISQIDLANKLSKKCNLNDRVKFFPGDIETISSCDNYDYILCTEVVEHLPLPYNGLRNLSDLSGYSTKIIISVPQHYSDTSVNIFYRQNDNNGNILIETKDIALLDNNRVKYRFYHKDYSLNEIKILLASMGFEIKLIKGVTFKPNNKIPVMKYIERINNKLGILNIDILFNKLFKWQYAKTIILKCKVKNDQTFK